ALRGEARQRRRIMTRDEKAAAREGLGEKLHALAVEYEAKRIACYLSGTDEPTTRGFINQAMEEGIDVLVPVSREDGLMDWALCDSDGESLDVLGMPIPTSELLGPMAVDGVDVMFIPASLVDRQGGRMGWGRGYFDRMLGSMALRPPVFAVVYDHEVVESVPIEVHDQGVDGAVTPTQIIRFG
ncbi:MAG: 5-formyltetrahydrofolate cyclo-ligase, partial [Pontimonas sp.]